MKSAYFFTLSAGIAAWFVVAACVMGVNAASSGGGTDSTIPADVNVRRVPVSERGWNLGRADEVEVVGLRAPVAAPSAAAGAITDLSDVQTVADMRVFAREVAERDANVRLIVINPEVTEVDYAVPGKLFRILPLRVTVRVLMDESGNAKVKLPWYGVFVKIEAKFDAWDISRALDERTASAPLDKFSRQAWMVQALAAIMKSYVE